jgi:hypothetical protein
VITVRLIKKRISQTLLLLDTSLALYIFFRSFFLRLWRHLKYLTHGTSEYKFLETIMAIYHHRYPMDISVLVGFSQGAN